MADRNPTRLAGAEPAEALAERVQRLRTELVALEGAAGSLPRDRRVEVGRRLVRIRAELDWLDETIRGWSL